MANYFNTLNLRQQLAQLGKCRFMQREEFADGCNVLQGQEGGDCGLWCPGSEPGPEHARPGLTSPTPCARPPSPRSAPPGRRPPTTASRSAPAKS